MRKIIFAVICLGFCSFSMAQEDSFPKPSKEHEVLKRFSGDWTTSSSCTMAPGTDPIPCSGSITGKMLGGFWMTCHLEGNMSGMKFNALQTIGYDAKRGKYVATWVDSMSDFMWKYEGELKGNRLIFHAEGPHYLKPGETMRFRDTYEFVSDTEIKMMSEGLLNGKWSAFMTGKATKHFSK